MKDSKKQAVLLCGGKATRLRPYSYKASKAQLTFLNLPLLSYPWKILEELQVSRFLLNSHLFPYEFKSMLDSISEKNQDIGIFFEKEPLGALGTLNSLKNKLQQSSYFIYINGDTLLFPSEENKIFEFEKEFLNSNLSALFYVTPFKQDFLKKRAFYCDLEKNLKRIDFLNSLESLKNKREKAYFFTGLALFKSSLLDFIKKGDTDLFRDLITPLLNQKKMKVFFDKKAYFLEVGNKESYLKSTQICLEKLWDSSENFIKKNLKKCFKRFDSHDLKVGLKHSQIWSSRLKALLLAPSSVKGLHLLKVKGFSVLGPQVTLFDKTFLEDCVLNSKTPLKGHLKREWIL
ncbi:MAG: NDP-sugar synthase [Bdellovibrionales bacterium]|nr:NDP-sugar synthase [Bdellovibrionales bacterium]